jgi:hypothetical protein
MRSMLLLLFALASIGATSTSTGGTPSTTVAGTTVISADGIAQGSLSFPEAATLTSKADIEVATDDATFVFVGLLLPECSTSDGLREVCMEVQIFDIEASGFSPSISTADPQRFPAGETRVFVVSDGHVEVTLRFDDLDGTSRVEVSDPLDATFESLARSCPATDCHHLGYGGVTHDVGEKGYVASMAYSIRDGRPDGSPVTAPGSNSAVACVYPSSSNPNASPQEGDHPTGCDMNPATSPEAPIHAASNLQQFVVQGAQVYLTGWFHLLENLLGPSGEVYAGFAAQQVNPADPVVEDPATYGAYGVWVDISAAGS